MYRVHIDMHLVTNGYFNITNTLQIATPDILNPFCFLNVFDICYHNSKLLKCFNPYW